MSLGAGTRLGPYEIQSAIGAGGMGEVYKARDTRLDRTVAIKILPAELSTDSDRRVRFERETRAGAALLHPHICTLHDIGTHDRTMTGRRFWKRQYRLEYAFRTGPPCTAVVGQAGRVFRCEADDRWNCA